uniref:EGF-like domain-containing protein n=1 Tax=Phaeomonas parva TaxID=124430 RepID=A0A6U4JH03_9STRA|mmetsp:Transcript_41598/g.130354  ORF Transcript_41598/g.130354 Transcript_41598/m.130354 type:complete len:558 (+) Transcript_41598:194-1867(+)|eukprot:CAMPEP_0118888116 /NCGR_PEP_ID=MMETSP1163-20130328/25558_1 /TAXON_ID=124430 /ORGANISM="Phaeomonas parva, Strain CCMP2877" /LENGTH=557 /DNA_ID=CAMNT_0006826679 /DNA_START=115 /DNA_END=1788 /DNA_ORIENTATION=+
MIYPRPAMLLGAAALWALALINPASAECEGTGYEVGDPAPACWDGSSRICCPEGLSLTWTNDYPELSRTGTEHVAAYHATVPDAGVDYNNGNQIPHTNLHACADFVGFCTPMIANDGSAATHSETQVGNFTGDGADIDVSLQLPEGAYTIIAHVRMYVNGSRVDAAIATFSRTVWPEISCPNDCSDQGTCVERVPADRNSGVCECTEGWEGEDCSQSKEDELSPEFMLIAFGGSVAFFFIVAGLFFVYARKFVKGAINSKLENEVFITSLVTLAKASISIASTALNVAACIQLATDRKTDTLVRLLAITLAGYDVLGFIFAAVQKQRMLGAMQKNLKKIHDVAASTDMTETSQYDRMIPRSHTGRVTQMVKSMDVTKPAEALRLQAVMLQHGIYDLMWDASYSAIRGFPTVFLYVDVVFAHESALSRLFVMSFASLCAFLGSRLSAILVLNERRASLRSVQEILSMQDIATALVEKGECDSLLSPQKATFYIKRSQTMDMQQLSDGTIKRYMTQLLQLTAEGVRQRVVGANRSCKDKVPPPTPPPGVVLANSGAEKV